MKIFTIGFTKKSAENFFTRLKQPGLVRLVDIRLNNFTQLAGFTKKNNLKYFLNEICKIDYVYLLTLAPTKEIIDSYRKSKGDWKTYERQFLSLIKTRQVENNINKNLIDGGCLLCSEESPEHCHRRLVAEYLRDKWGNVEIIHL